MTLILSLANRQFTVQLSDRRLTDFPPIHGGGEPRNVLTEEANKAGALVCGDARLAYSCTGLAFTGPPDRRTFDTRLWLLRAILKAAPPEYQIEFITERFRQIASREFLTNPHILSRPKCERKLSVMLSGFWNTTLGCIPAGWVSTNFQQNFDLGTGTQDPAEPWDEFRCWRWHQEAPPIGPYAHVERLGRWRGVPNVSMDRLLDRLRQDRPVDAIIGSALKVIHQASDADITENTVGKQISVVVVPMDVCESVRFSSESNVVTDDVFVPDVLVAIGPHTCHWMSLKLTKPATSESPHPASVPRVHRKALCPCGSGRIYE
jgi:hypothetical protein